LVCPNVDSDCATSVKSANAIATKVLWLIRFMIKMSPSSSPSEESVKTR
jgi:hypothetical protein